MKFTDAHICSAKTGEVLKIFKGFELLSGKQYFHAWCCGNFYRITDEKVRDLGDGNVYVAYVE